MEKLSTKLMLIGVVLIGLGFVIGAFLLNWIFGIVVLGFVIALLGCFISENDYYDDWEE